MDGHRVNTLVPAEEQDLRWITHPSTFLMSGGLLLSLLWASLLEINAAAPLVLLSSPTLDAPPTAVGLFLSGFSFLSSPAASRPPAAGRILSAPLLASSKEVVVVVAVELLVLRSDSKNCSLDCRVLAAVVEVRGAGVGLAAVGVPASRVVQGALRSSRSRVS